MKAGRVMGDNTSYKKAISIKRYNVMIGLIKRHKDKIPEFMFESLVAAKPEPSFDDLNTLVYKVQQIEVAAEKNPQNVLMELFAPEINELKSRKFVVWQLQKAVKEKELPAIIEIFDRFYDGFAKLKSLKEKLEKIEIDHENPRYKEILNKISKKDCMNADAVEEDIKDFEQMIRTGEIFLFYSDGKAKDEWGNPERKDCKPIADMAKQMFLKKIKEDFSSKGYVTKKLEKVLDGDIRNVGRAFWGFEMMVAKVDKLEARLKRHSRSMKPEEAAAFEKMLKDPDNYYIAVTKMGELEAKLDPTGDSTLIAFYRRMVENYQKQGMVTTELEKYLKKPLGEAAKFFETYDENFRKYYRISNYMEKKRCFHFDEKKIAEINALLNDPLKRYELEAKIVACEREAADFTQKCEQSAAKMEELGFEVNYLYELFEDYSQTTADIKAAFNIYASRIKKLIAIRDKALPRLRSFNVKELEFVIENIRDSIGETANYPKIVEQLIKAEEAAKKGDGQNYTGYHKSRLEYLKSKGVNTEPILRMANYDMFGYAGFINACEFIEFKNRSAEIKMLLKILNISILPPEVAAVLQSNPAELLADFK